MTSSRSAIGRLLGTEGSPDEKIFTTMHESPSLRVSTSGASLSSQTPMNFRSQRRMKISLSPRPRVPASIFRLGGRRYHELATLRKKQTNTCN
ncbi:MAG: hypothetical protein F6K41_08860 [Symploca sp. SIO3E6]|nr:hypothetical protein [Caldora sp. SIO3E6]